MLFRLRHWVLAFVMGLAALAIVPACAAQPGAKEFLAKLYGNYTGKGKGVDYSTPANVKRYFTPELAKLLLDNVAAAAKRGDVPDLEGDPFIDAQDWKLTELAIAVSDLGPDSATGKVSFKNMGEPKTVTLALKRTKDGWRIDDIEWPDGHGSLRKLLSGTTNA